MSAASKHGLDRSGERVWPHYDAITYATAKDALEEAKELQADGLCVDLEVDELAIQQLSRHAAVIVGASRLIQRYGTEPLCPCCDQETHEEASQ